MKSQKTFCRTSDVSALRCQSVTATDRKLAFKAQFKKRKEKKAYAIFKRNSSLQPLCLKHLFKKQFPVQLLGHSDTDRACTCIVSYSVCVRTACPSRSQIGGRLHVVITGASVGDHKLEVDYTSTGASVYDHNLEVDCTSS